jgi:hypothetical protein
VTDEAAYQLQLMKANMANKATKVSACPNNWFLPVFGLTNSMHYCHPQLKNMTSGFFTDLQSRYG